MRHALARLTPFTRIIIMHLIGIQQGGNKEREEKESEDVRWREVGINRGFLLGCSLYREIAPCYFATTTTTDTYFMASPLILSTSRPICIPWLVPPVAFTC